MMQISKEQMADLAARKQAQDGAAAGGATGGATEGGGTGKGPQAEAKSGKAETSSQDKKGTSKDAPTQPPTPPPPVPPPTVIEPCPLPEKRILLYLLFYVTGNDHGDTFFAEAAQTRLQNIKASLGYDDAIHKVHCPPIQDLGEIAIIVARYIAKYGGSTVAFCKEVGVFSHAALDGPIGSKESSVDPSTPASYCQMELSGWSKIFFNWWKEGPLFTAYGCNTANEGRGKSFANNLSLQTNFSGVEVWGQSTSSYPSFVPDLRITTMARNMNCGWDVGPTYQVGGNQGEGWKATSPSFSYPSANPMNCYTNGASVRSTHQGFYNDHRKTFTLVKV